MQPPDCEISAVHLITVMWLVRWLDYIVSLLSHTGFATLEKIALNSYKTPRFAFEVLAGVTIMISICEITSCIPMKVKRSGIERLVFRRKLNVLGYNTVYSDESQTFWDITQCSLVKVELCGIERLVFR
jgi:hypothetical protein